MTAEAKREAIEKVYGNVRIKGTNLSDMQERQIHAIYGRLVDSGLFVEYDDLKHTYITRMGNTQMAKKRANNMSIFELRDAVSKAVYNSKEQEGYQYTLFDWQQEIEGKEQEKEWKKNLK